MQGELSGDLGISGLRVVGQVLSEGFGNAHGGWEGRGGVRGGGGGRGLGELVVACLVLCPSGL